MKNLIKYALLALLSVWLWRVLPDNNRPYHVNGHGTFTIPGFDPFSQFLALNAGQGAQPHGYWFGASVGPTTATPNQAINNDLFLPSPSDQAVGCFEATFNIFTNTSGSPDVVQPGFGTDNSEYGGCPLWPYFAVAGGHANQPTGYTGITVPAGQSIMNTVYRTDSLLIEPYGHCDAGIPINSTTFSGGVVTVNLGGSGNCIWTSNDSCGGTPGGAAPGQYVQINGSSVAALNTAASTVQGVGFYKITNSTASTIQFNGSASQVCSSNCGTAYSPGPSGLPPYTMPVGGGDGATTPRANLGLVNGSQSLNYDLTGIAICYPFTSFNGDLSNFGTGPGLSAGSPGGMNGMDY